MLRASDQLGPRPDTECTLTQFVHLTAGQRFPIGPAFGQRQRCAAKYCGAKRVLSLPVVFLQLSVVGAGLILSLLASPIAAQRVQFPTPAQPVQATSPYTVAPNPYSAAPPTTFAAPGIPAPPVYSPYPTTPFGAAPATAPPLPAYSPAAIGPPPAFDPYAVGQWSRRLHHRLHPTRRPQPRSLQRHNLWPTTAATADSHQPVPISAAPTTSR